MNGGVPASGDQLAWSSASWWYSFASSAARRTWCVVARPVFASIVRITISSSFCAISVVEYASPFWPCCAM